MSLLDTNGTGDDLSISPREKKDRLFGVTGFEISEGSGSRAKG
jgi:hypothetical protein